MMLRWVRVLSIGIVAGIIVALAFNYRMIFIPPLKLILYAGIAVYAIYFAAPPSERDGQAKRVRTIQIRPPEKSN
jgi:hypothetical protein